jgi:hypothetical protein
MVLTKAGDIDVSHDDHPIVVFREDCIIDDIYHIEKILVEE